MAALRYGVTTRASCLMAAGFTALLCGLTLGVVDLVRAGVLALALPLVALVFVHRSRVTITNRRTVEPARTTAGSSVTVHLDIANTSVLRTGALLLEDQLPEQLSGQARFVLPNLWGRERRMVSYRIPAPSRGRYRTGPLRMRLSDPFRLVDLTRSFADVREFLVTPVVEPLRRVEPPRSDDVGDDAGSHSIGMHGADDASTREYRTGDPLRKIHWRSSARTGALMVRLEERPWQGRVTALLDLRQAAHATAPHATAASDPRDGDSLEWIVSAAASIGSHLMVAGREVGLLTDAGRGRVGFDGPAALLEYLATVRPSPELHLAGQGAGLRLAARDSAVLALLGHLDPDTVSMLVRSRPRATALPAVALLLDTPTWAGRPAADPVPGVRALTAAGWQVAVARRGDRIADAWHTLLRGRAGSVVPT